MRYILTAIIVLNLFFLGPGSVLDAVANTVTFEGKVLAVEDKEVLVSSGGEILLQEVSIRISNGPEKGRIITLTNALTGHPYFDLNVKPGDSVVIQQEPGAEAEQYFISDYARQRPLAVIVGLFALTLVVIGGLKGLKAVITLIIMGVGIVYVVLPLILKGYNPLLVTVGLCSLLAGLFLIFVSGWNKKTLVATLGSIGGLVIAGILAFIVGRASFLSGLASDEAQILQFSSGNLDFQGLLFSGMIIGALGAILDVGVGIASSMEQILEADPTADMTTFLRRGMAVGQDMLVTMSNTLILAYVGSSLPLLLLFFLHDTPWSSVVNLEMIAAEVVRAMVGSIGLALAIPLTVVLSCLIFQKTAEH